MGHSLEHKEFASSLLEQLATATFVLDRDGRVMIWNHSCERLTGVPASELVGTRDHWKAFYSKKRMCLADVIIQGRTDELTNLYPVHAQPSIHGNGYKAENWCVMPRIGTRLYLTVDAAPIYDEQGTLIAIVQSMRDNTEYKNAQSRLEELSVTDELTGLHNRRFFNEHLNTEWTRGIRSQEPLSLILLDIDYFKQYNDTHGHVAGDECLQSIAGVLQRSLLRSSDMATRYGGEEFCLLLPNTPIESALIVAQRIRSTMARLDICHKTSCVSDAVTLSDGIACLKPSLQDSPTRLVTLADEALYEAKALGRNQSQRAVRAGL